MSPLLLIVLAASPTTPEIAKEAVIVQSPPAWELASEGHLALSLQRLGMLADLKLRAKRKLYLSDSEFLADNSLTLALTAQVSPVFAHAGAQVDFQPASFLKLSGGYHFVGYFGAMGRLRQPTNCENLNTLTASETRCDFHPIYFEHVDEGVPASGHRFWLEAQVMGRVGPVIAVGSVRGEQWLMNSPGQYWVNELYGISQTRSDTVISGGGALLYAVLDAEGRRPELLVGVADELAWSLGPNSFFNRVGPVAMLRAPKWGAWRDVSAQLAVLFYTHERYMVGTPFLALAFSAATPDLLTRAER